jgi:hypothetical protein
MAAAAGLAAAIAIALLFRAPRASPAAPAKPPVRPTVGLASMDPALSEEAVLFDPTPLFLPTEWNSTRKELPRREPGDEFTGYPDKPAFGEDELAIGLPPPIAVPAHLSDALEAYPPGTPFLGFGRTGYRPPVLPDRGAYVEIVAAGTGRLVLAKALLDAQPPGNGTWLQPLEFLVAVDPAGLVGPPVLTVRSGSEEVNGYFRHYLAETLRVGDRLAPGFYRISVGP